MNINAALESREIVIYHNDSGDVKVELLLQDENLWLSQDRMAELFDVNVPAISKHLSNIYAEGELDKGATVSILEIVQTEGKRQVKRSKEFYNLDAFLQLSDHEILQNAGKISHEIAKSFAEAQFETYKKIQDAIYKSDFDKLVEKTKENKPKCIGAKKGEKLDREKVKGL
ncbi:MAG: hypothetical protein Ta2F_17790 [Termitinemataceae bacterium]|nr:MAG: hypothetical protein Ta2F_17790 [Termitinemataceae bacterium]